MLNRNAMEAIASILQISALYDINGYTKEVRRVLSILNDKYGLSSDLELSDSKTPSFDGFVYGIGFVDIFIEKAIIKEVFIQTFRIVGVVYNIESQTVMYKWGLAELETINKSTDTSVVHFKIIPCHSTF